MMKNEAIELAIESLEGQIISYNILFNKLTDYGDKEKFKKQINEAISILEGLKDEVKDENR